MNELKPCPFCGGKALLRHDYTLNWSSYVQCEKYRLESVRIFRSFEYASDDKAIEAWNRRTDDGNRKV